MDQKQLEEEGIGVSFEFAEKAVKEFLRRNIQIPEPEISVEYLKADK